MTSNPPPYAPDETKGLYPTAQAPLPQQQQPGVYTNPGTATVTYYPSGAPQQQPQQMVIAQPGQVVIAQQQPRPSFACHIVCAVCGCCFCFWPLALVALIVACKNSCLHRPYSYQRSEMDVVGWAIRGLGLPEIRLVLTGGENICVFTVICYTAHHFQPTL